jgi:sugar lactone lactonase YvrE
MLVLDSTQGIVEQSAQLAQGFYRLALEYRWNSTVLPPPLAVRWRRPDADWEIIPSHMLHNPPAPNVGLLATYFPGSVSEGRSLDQRKELFIGPAVDLALPYNVRWTGQVAAARAGEYLLATLADGSNQLFIDGRLLLDGRPAEGAATVYSEGVIYLAQGWHMVEIYYAPGSEEPEFQLLWQPPGSGPASLSSTYLSPLPGATNPGALPPLPPLVDPRLGDERFALSQALDAWQPQLRVPPTNLPGLAFEPRWRVGAGCGAADDQVNQPHGVALDAERGRLFVADTMNRRIAVYGLDGASDNPIDSELFQEPFDVELTPDGALLILDALVQQVFRVDRASEHVEPISLATSFYRPRGLAVDTAGNLIVADTGGGRAAILQSNGQAAGQYGGRETLLGRGQPVDALWADGALWAVSAEDGRLWRLDTGGSMTVVQPTNTLTGPHLAGLPDGRFFVSDPGRGLVLFHAKNGQPLGQFAAHGVIVTPTGIDVALNNDQVYLAVVDSMACTISLWELMFAALPHGS